MARVDIDLANQVKRYASLHRQPIAVIIRDALILLMEEYPSGADPSGSHRLSAHEFLADRYESPLDMLIGETDSAGLEALLSGTNEAVVETILTETDNGPENASARKAGLVDRTSARKTESAATPTDMPAGGRSRTRSDRQAARAKVPQHRRGR
jgi:hypothetical protein